MNGVLCVQPIIKLDYINLSDWSNLGFRNFLFFIHKNQSSFVWVEIILSHMSVIGEAYYYVD